MLFSIIGKIQPDCPNVSVTVVKTERVNKKASKYVQENLRASRVQFVPFLFNIQSQCVPC